MTVMCKKKKRNKKVNHKNAPFKPVKFHQPHHSSVEFVFQYHSLLMSIKTTYGWKCLFFEPAERCYRQFLNGENEVPAAGLSPLL